LALAQANETRDRLLKAHPDLGAENVQIVPITTSGDRYGVDRSGGGPQAQPLPGSGGVKGLFTKEIEEALGDGRVDIAVHSMKDLPTLLPDVLTVACVLPREDPRDGLVVGSGIKGIGSLGELPASVVVGTSSLRRRAQILHLRPDLKVVEFRGNVETRLAKLKAGRADATLLAMAGLNRLGLARAASAILDSDEILPAVAQGAIGIECRKADDFIRGVLAALNDADTEMAISAERALLAALDGSCHTPIAALAHREGAKLILRAAIYRPDGSEMLSARREGGLADAAGMGRDAGLELRARAGAGFFEQA
jgi:hydroxymethylbilane synthase